MADKKEEKAIPVFTVLKNNATLKNIFLLDTPPSLPDPHKPIKFVEDSDPPMGEFEETLLVGRHPDCNITLEHPSISRFHIRIHSSPSSHHLSVSDLSSVHGTWVSGKKIEAGVRVELNEGDTIQLGGSSRVYRLHWVPLSRAYDMENPFVSPVDVSMQVEEGEEGTDQDENCFFLANSQTQSLDHGSEGTGLGFSEENSNSWLQNVMIPSAPPLPEYMNSPAFSSHWSEQHATGSPSPRSSLRVLTKTEIRQFEKDNQSPQPSLGTEMLAGLVESQCQLKEDHDQSEMPRFFQQSRVEEFANSPLSNSNVISRISDKKCEKENQTPEPLAGTGGLSGTENPEKTSPENLNSSLLDEEIDHQVAEVLQIVENGDPFRIDYEQREILLLQSGPLATESVNSPLSGGNDLSEIENQQFDESNRSPHIPFANGGSQKENPESPLIRSEQKSNLPSIWSRRGKPSSVLQIQTGWSKGRDKVSDKNAEVELPHQQDIEENAISKALFTGSDGDDKVFTPDRENFTPNTLILRSMKNLDKEEQIKDSVSNGSSSLKYKAISKALLTGLLDRDEEESFTPDKENFTPNTLLLRFMKKMSKVEEIKHSNILRSSSSANAVNHNCLEDVLAPSVKEKRTPKVLQERKSVRPSSRNQENSKPQVMARKSKVERVPFQPLLEHFSGKSKSEASILSATKKNSNFVNFVQTIEKNNYIGKEKKRWNMVVDTTCLLNKESRKALQLLQGLKGTQLIIPRIVIRELDCMKRRGNLFRRNTEASFALQWIEECMVNTTLWIHVQSSEEEGRPIALTPPASPQSRFTEGTCGFYSGVASSLPFSPWGSLLEIVSPTAEDHILEYALLFRRKKNDGRLVLLTNDVTLKIKSMAEGLICETAEEFRESLVNPFSERFLWTDSSPRGPTWSYADDIFLREKYHSCHSRKPSKSGEGSAKGLKLILLHNSRHAQTPVS